MRTITLVLDELDWNTIQNEFAKRQARRDGDGILLPDGDSNIQGAILAECIRDLDDFRAMYEVENP